MANSPLEYTLRVTMRRFRVLGSPHNGLHTDLKFQNQAIQCCLFEPRGAKYGKAVGRERAASVYATTRC